VNTTIVHNVYVDRTVYVNNSTNRTSYNGGPSGLAVRPKPAELAAAKAPHLAMTQAQRQHVQVAGQDRRLLANVNHNRPPVLAVARPLSTGNRPAGLVPVTSSDRAKAEPHAAPAAHVAPAAPAPPPHIAPAIHIPPEHVAPATHVPLAHPAPVAPPPAAHVAPATHVPVPHIAPAIPAPAVHRTPAAPPVRAKPKPTAHRTPHAPEATKGPSQ
jgi:hypothetical protein